jgi:hypothetical protein
MESEFLMDALQADVDDEDSETLYASGDTLGKLWAFINQVCVIVGCMCDGRYHVQKDPAAFHDMLRCRACSCRARPRAQDADTAHG